MKSTQSEAKGLMHGKSPYQAKGRHSEATSPYITKPHRRCPRGLYELAIKANGGTRDSVHESMAAL